MLDNTQKGLEAVTADKGASTNGLKYLCQCDISVCCP